MTSQEEYHNNLHRQINTVSKFADWTYHDVRLDCDGESIIRTSERLNALEAQHGIEYVFGVLGSWAQKTAWRIESAIGKQNSMMQPQLEEGDSSTYSTEERAELSAIQFIVAVGNDDLEMAEAFFNVAKSAGPEDIAAFVFSVLGKCIQLSAEAKEIVQRRKWLQNQSTE